MWQWKKHSPKQVSDIYSPNPHLNKTPQSELLLNWYLLRNTIFKSDTSTFGIQSHKIHIFNFSIHICCSQSALTDLELESQRKKIKCIWLFTSSCEHLILRKVIKLPLIHLLYVLPLAMWGYILWNLHIWSWLNSLYSDRLLKKTKTHMLSTHTTARLPEHTFSLPY